jgi:stage II sporulation protein D
MPATAPAATTFVIKGAGFGHGVGMSQYGAQGLARHGSNYRQILGRYYSHTTIGSASTRTIRVLLRSGGPYSVSHVSRAGKKKLNPAKSYAVRTRGGKIALSGGGKTLRFSSGVHLSGPNGYTRIGGSAYRGSMELRSGLVAINVVPLDAYVQGVIPGEMPPSWLPEALKVQAVAARSYALATDAGGPLFDQYADTRSQVYNGMSAEQPSTNAAARATAGQVVRYQGQVATTYYFSTSGGRTENIENSFLGAAPQPYLKSVKDPYDNISPRHRWQFRFTRARMQSKLGGLCKGKFKGITVVKRGVSPRVVSADVVCSRGRTRTTGPTLRSRLGLYDSWFSVTKAGVKPPEDKALDIPIFTKLVHPRTIAGSFSPRPRSVDVERLEGGHWKLIARGLTNRVGQYSVPVYAIGTYRVTGNGVRTEPVTLRK